MERTLLALSSDGVTSYEVIFHVEGVKLSIKCGCPAGENGKLCRHKLGFLRGDKKMLLDSKQGPEFEEVQQWIRKSRLHHLVRQLDDAETAMGDLKETIRVLKREIEIGTEGR